MKQMVAEQIGDAFYGYKYSIENTNGGNYNHEYTVSVSTYTKAVNSTGAGIIAGTIGGGIAAETLLLLSSQFRSSVPLPTSNLHYL